MAWLWTAAVLTFWSGLADRCRAAVPQPDPNSPAATLKRYQIEPSTAGVLEVLRQRQPSAEGRERIAQLVGDLGNESYEIREAASQHLAALGTMAEPALREATQSDDMEVVFRARRLLANCGRGQAEDVLAAALEWLRQSPTPQATPLLLDLLPVVPDAFHQTVCETLWACVGPGDARRLRQAIDDQRRGRSSGGDSRPGTGRRGRGRERPGPLLRDKEEATRLVAAQALLDRSPQPSIAALLELLDARDAAIREQAAWLLQQVSGIPPVADPPPDLAAAAVQLEGLGGHGRRRSSAAAGPEAIAGRPLRDDPHRDVLR